jgi:hypothetical protein
MMPSTGFAQKCESHPRQWVDGFNCYLHEGSYCSNANNSSWLIVQFQPSVVEPVMNIHQLVVRRIAMFSVQVQAADALVSDLEEGGQQSCIVCHQDTRDQNLIAR